SSHPVRKANRRSAARASARTPYTSGRGNASNVGGGQRLTRRPSQTPSSRKPFCWLMVNKTLKRCPCGDVTARLGGEGSGMIRPVAKMNPPRRQDRGGGEARLS